MKVSLILLLLLLACEFVLLMGVTRSRQRRITSTKRPIHPFNRLVRQSPRTKSFGISPRRPTRAFPTRNRPGVTLRPSFRTTFRSNTTPFRRSITPRPVSRLQAPPRRTVIRQRNPFVDNGPPGLKPPRGVADRLNRARLKDFMSLGAMLLRRTFIRKT